MESEQFWEDVPVSDADDRKLFIGGLHNTDEEKLREHFEVYGEIETIEVKRDPTTCIPRGFGFVTFKSTEALNQVEAAGDHIINGKKVDPKKAKGKLGRIFVERLSPDLTDGDIETYFAQFGTIVETNIPFDNEKNQRKGYCFIVFESNEVVKNLLKWQHTIKGKDVEVQRSVPKAYRTGVPARGGPMAFGGRGRGIRGPLRGRRGGAMLGSFQGRRGGFVARGGVQTRGGWRGGRDEPMMETFGARGGSRGSGGVPSPNGRQGGRGEPMMESFEARDGHQFHGGWREETPMMNMFETRDGSRGCGGVPSRNGRQGGRGEPMMESFEARDGHQSHGGWREERPMMNRFETRGGSRGRGGVPSRNGRQGGRGEPMMESFEARDSNQSHGVWREERPVMDRFETRGESTAREARGGYQPRDMWQGERVEPMAGNFGNRGFGGFREGNYGQNGGFRVRGRRQRHQPY